MRRVIGRIVTKLRGAVEGLHTSQVDDAFKVKQSLLVNAACRKSTTITTRLYQAVNLGSHPTSYATMDLFLRAATGANSTASSSNVESAGEGISGGYEGNSLTLKICIAFFLGLAMYNVLELQVLIFGTFQRFQGLYFWSLVISSLGIIPYSLGFLFKYFSVLTGSNRWGSVFLLTIGWYPMVSLPSIRRYLPTDSAQVTGQAIVLWSRLHLVVTGERGDRILKYTKWMIIIDAIVLHCPTTVLTIGSNVPIHSFVKGYSVMEKIQMCGFFVQEIILSSIYILETIKILKTSIQPNTRRLMYQLLAINLLIIAMDLGLLGLEAASLYILETIVKGFLYSVKLKLEFAILNKLVKFVGKSGSDANQARTQSLAYVEDNKDEEKRTGSSKNGSSTALGSPNDTSDFVDLSRIKSDITHASPPPSFGGRHSSAVRRGIDDFDFDLAQLEHSDTFSSRHGRANGELEGYS